MSDGGGVDDFAGDTSDSNSGRDRCHGEIIVEYLENGSVTIQSAED